MPTKPPSQNPSAGGACSRGGWPRGPWRLTRAEPGLGAPMFRALPRHGWHLAVISFSARALTMPGPCRGGTPPPGPPPRVGHRRRPGGGLPGRAGRPHAPPPGTPRGRAGRVVPPGLRLPDGPRGGQNRHSGAPRVHGDCCWEGERGARSDEGGEGRRGGGPRLRQARPGRHPEPRWPPARASRSVPGSSASPTGIYSFLNICVDFFFKRKTKHSYLNTLNIVSKS